MSRSHILLFLFTASLYFGCDDNPSNSSDTGIELQEIEDEDDNNGCPAYALACGTGCVPEGSDCCDDEGHYCELGWECCSQGCMLRGGDCCNDQIYCPPGRICHENDTCLLFEELNPTETYGDGTCSELYLCMKSCSFQGLMTDCFRNCRSSATEEANETLQAFMECQTQCSEATDNDREFWICYENRCPSQANNCFGSFYPPD